jgi:hypothetical protein
MATSFKRNDLLIASAAVGVLGYIIGTPIGFNVFKLLSNKKTVF